MIHLLRDTFQQVYKIFKRRGFRVAAALATVFLFCPGSNVLNAEAGDPERAIVSAGSHSTTLDIETLAQNPAWWPKTVTLTQALSVPLMTKGGPSGQAEAPIHTVVRLVRITGRQVEIEFLNQRILASFTSTDVLERAGELARSAIANGATAKPASSSPSARILPASPMVEASRYRKEAEEVTDDIQAKYWMPKSQRYSKKPGSSEPEMVWGAGVMFSALVGAARNEPDRYKPHLGKFFEGLNGYWDSKAKPPGYEPAPTGGNGHDKYYDDNAWLAITFLEAYELTRVQQYHRRAEETLDFVLSGWDNVLEGGIWWHEAHEKKTPGKNTCANAPTAVACLISAKLSPQPQVAESRLAWAKKIQQWTTAKLQLQDGLFADSIQIDGGMNKGRLTYNSALMLRANLGLYRATRESRYLVEAQRIGRAAEAFMDPSKNAFRDAVKWAHLMVEADLELYRTTHEEYLLARAKKNADYYYEQWKSNRPEDLISVASISRTLWLLADEESETGRRFWAAVDRGETH